MAITIIISIKVKPLRLSLSVMSTRTILLILRFRKIFRLEGKPNDPTDSDVKDARVRSLGNQSMSQLQRITLSPADCAGAPLTNPFNVFSNGDVSGE